MPLGTPVTATPLALRTRYDALFGYLAQPVNGHTFPICIGETGSAFVRWPLPPPDNNPARSPCTACHMHQGLWIRGETLSPNQNPQVLKLLGAPLVPELQVSSLRTPW